MTFVWSGLRRSGKHLQRKDLMQKGNVHALQALFPLRRGLLRESRTLRLPLLLSPSLQEGGLRVWGGLGMHLVRLPVGFPLLPLDLGPARGVEVPLDARPVLASALLSPLLLRELRSRELLARSGPLLPALLLHWLALPHSSLHALRGGESRESSEVRSCSRSSSAPRSSA